MDTKLLRFSLIRCLALGAIPDRVTRAQAPLLYYRAAFTNAASRMPGGALAAIREKPRLLQYGARRTLRAWPIRLPQPSAESASRYPVNRFCTAPRG